MGTTYHVVALLKILVSGGQWGAMDTHMGLRVMLSSFGGARYARTPMVALEYTRYTVCDCYLVTFANHGMNLV